MLTATNTEKTFPSRSGLPEEVRSLDGAIIAARLAEFR